VAAASGGLDGAAPQSDESRQAMPPEHAGQVPPPQSTSVSAPLRKPSEHVAAGPAEEEAEAEAGRVDAEGEAEAAERVAEGVMEADAPRDKLDVGVGDGEVDELGEAGSVTETVGETAALVEGVGEAGVETDAVGVGVGDCGDAVGVIDGEVDGVVLDELPTECEGVGVGVVVAVIEGDVECVGVALTLCVAVVDSVGVCVTAVDAALAALVAVAPLGEAVAPLFVGVWLVPAAKDGLTVAVGETEGVEVALSDGEEPPGSDCVGVADAVRVGDDSGTTVDDADGVGVGESDAVGDVDSDGVGVGDDVGVSDGVGVSVTPLHVLEAAPVHEPVEQTQPEKSAEDEELAGHVPEHAEAGPPLVLIAVAWNVPAAQGEQLMSDVAVPATAK